MHLVYINPNSTVAMTESIVLSARAAAPGVRITGLTNATGPAAIQGAADGEAAVPGLLNCLTEAEGMGADAIIIACFDDTGLAEAQRAARCPVLGIGQSAYVMAHLLGLRFSVVTSLAVSIPVIARNIETSGFAPLCASVRASGLPVLTIEEGSEETRAHLAKEIMAAVEGDGAEGVVLGCAGMSHMRADLRKRSGIPLIDGVTASAHLALAAVGYGALGVDGVE